ncbi:MAG: hypothetical protein FWD23_15420 [Oscillospiraceae bacterium]|nr:hypothetical protein [Oscillospiraceae bacterium]
MILMAQNRLRKPSCQHEWKTEQTTEYHLGGRDGTPMYRVYLYKCSLCGKFKKIKM